MFSYAAFGLGIRSQIPLPELLPEEAEADVVLCRGGADFPAPPGNGWGSLIQASKNKVLLCIKGVGQYLITNGREIQVHTSSEAEESNLHLGLMGPCMALLLHQRGEVVFHASAVEIQGRAVAFLGNSGAGKSAVALTLTRRGNSLLSDDLGVVRCVEGVPVVMPAFPIIRMWPDVILSLGGEPEALPRVRSNHDKRSERFRAGFSPSPVPLSRLYVLEYGEALEIEPILPRDALKEMIRHLYVAPYGLDLLRVIGLGTVFDKFGALAARVPVFRLRRPRDLGALPEIARAVEEHMGREF